VSRWSTLFHDCSEYPGLAGIYDHKYLDRPVPFTTDTGLDRQTGLPAATDTGLDRDRPVNVAEETVHYLFTGIPA
jgi:hypothetical protein